MWTAASGIGRSLIVPFIAVGVLTVGSCGLYVTHSIRVAGAAESEMARLEQINEENLAAQARLARGNESLQAALLQQRDEIEAVRRLADAATAKIQQVPASGEGEICPVDCIVPAYE